MATASQIDQIDQNSADIAALQGKSSRYVIELDVSQYPDPADLQTALTAAWRTASGAGVGDTPAQYTTLVNLYSTSEPNNHEYTWLTLNNTTEWIDRGASTVAIATNSSLGIVQGTPDTVESNVHINDGNIYVDTDGTMSLLGWR